MTARMRCLTAFISSEREVRPVTPEEAKWALWPRVDNAMVKAPARAFQWRKTLEDLAQAKGRIGSCVSGILRLAPLSPEIVEANSDRAQPTAMRLDNLSRTVQISPIAAPGG